MDDAKLVEQLLEVRKTMSRKKISDATGLSQAKIYNLEKGRAFKDGEREALIKWFDNADFQMPIEAQPRQPTIVNQPPVNVPSIPKSQPSKPVVISNPKIPHREDGVRRISHSELRTFKECRRKWWLAWYRNLQLLHESPTGPLAIGNRIHRALEAYYVPEGQEPVNPRHALELLITEDYTELAKRYDNFVVPEDVRAQFTKDADLERVMLEGYVKYIEETGVDTELEVVAPEKYVEVDIDVAHGTDDQTKLIGRLDVQAIRTTDGKRLFIDHKTVQEFGTPAVLLPLDEQMLHYHFLQILDPEESSRCAGAIYNMLRKVKRTAAARPPFFTRMEIQHNKHQIDSYEHRVMGTVEDMLGVQDQLDAGYDHRSVAYPNPTRDCKWKCQFLPVCGMLDDGSRAEDMITNLYVERNPLSYYEKNTKG